MTDKVVGALLIREGSYAVEIRVAHQLLPGAQLQPIPLIGGDVIHPLPLLLDAVQLALTGMVPEGVKAFQVVCDE